MYTIGKNFINTYLSGYEKEKWLKDLEIIHLLEEGIYRLEKKVESLATGEYRSECSQDEDSEKVIGCLKTVTGIRPDDSKLHKTLRLALKIIEEQEDKEQALKNLNEIRDVYIKYLSNLDKFLVHGLPPYPPRWKK